MNTEYCLFPPLGLGGGDADESLHLNRNIAP